MDEGGEMMDLNHTEFQALSDFEARQMRFAVSDMILQAYQEGLNVVIGNYDKPIQDLIAANRSALVRLGFVDSDELAGVLAISLRDNVKEER